MLKRGLTGTRQRRTALQCGLRGSKTLPLLGLGFAATGWAALLPDRPERVCCETGRRRNFIADAVEASEMHL